MGVYRKIVAVFSLLVIFGMAILLPVLPKRNFSENENRMLKDFPEINADNLVSGKLTADIEEYYNDHIPFRDDLVAFKSNYQQAIGYKELGGVYLAGDRLLQHIDEPNPDVLVGRMKKLRDNLADTDIRISLMVIPTDACVYSDELPSHATVVDEMEKINSIYQNTDAVKVDVATALMEAKNKDIDGDGKEDNLFYKLDHHWTYYGAYIGYRSFMEAAGYEPRKINDFEKVKVSDDYRGSLYSKALVSTIDSDEIIVPSLENEKLKVFNRDKNTDTDYYYYDEFLNQKDKYCYFGGGNPSVMVIENENAKTDREILLIKDSFANSMIPFMVGDFKKIHILDLRYYVRHASDYAKENENIKDVLVLYNLDSLNINNGIVKIK